MRRSNKITKRMKALTKARDRRRVIAQSRAALCHLFTLRLVLSRSPSLEGKRVNHVHFRTQRLVHLPMPFEQLFALQRACGRIAHCT